MKRLLTVIVVVLVVAWCLLVLLSWLLSAMMVEGVRSLLSGEGVRWFFAHFADGLASPLLVWLLLAAMAGGCLHRSGLIASSAAFHRGTGLRVAVLLVLLYVAAIVLLVAPPHALLLSATGTLAHSPFSRALVPLVCFGVVLGSVAYGVTLRRFTSLTDIIDALIHGLRAAAPLLFLYVLATQLLQSVFFVFYS